METVAISYGNFGKETGISMKSMNTNYNEIITKLFLNKMLHSVGM